MTLPLYAFVLLCVWGFFCCFVPPPKGGAICASVCAYVFRPVVFSHVCERASVFLCGLRPSVMCASVRGCVFLCGLWSSDTAGDGERITHPSELKDLEWSSFNCVFGYPLLGTCCTAP